MSEEKRIYLDNNATTPVAPEVKKAIIKYMDECYGNPSSIHKEGKEARKAIDDARRSIAQLLNCTANRIIFTGCGSESNNLAIKGVAFKNLHRRNHIITSKIEHPSVLHTCKWLERFGFETSYLEVDRYGIVDPDDLEKAITEKTCLITIMTANNETGSIQPIAELSKISRRHGILFHTDATQAIGKIRVDVKELGVDMLTLSGHKFYGPKGVGVLYINKDIEIESLIHGGSQENSLRAGTENIIGIVGLSKAAEIALRRLSEMERVCNLRDSLEKGIKGIMPDSRLNGHREKRLPNTLNMLLPGFRGESIVLSLDQKGVSISSGSACMAGSSRPSHALLAMGLTEEEAHCSIRISLGPDNTHEEIEKTISLIKEVVEESHSSVRFIRSC